MKPSKTQTYGDLRRDRVWHPVFGMGWHVFAAGENKDRFEADSGLVIPLPWVMLGVGTPSYYQACEIARAIRADEPEHCSAEEEMWRTIVLASGETYAFRADGPGEMPPAREIPDIPDERDETSASPPRQVDPDPKTTPRADGDLLSLVRDHHPLRRAASDLQCMEWLQEHLETTC